MIRDISTKEGSKAVYEAFKQKESALHLLVNNAGVALEEQVKFANNQNLDFESAESVSEHMLRDTDEAWTNTFKTNSQAIFFTSALFLPVLSKGCETFRGYTSSIVNITSISGILKGPSSGQFAYAASKAAALQTTRLVGVSLRGGTALTQFFLHACGRNLANTLVKTKIRCNTIAPGAGSKSVTLDAWR